MTLVLDAEALIALERGDRRAVLLLDGAEHPGRDVAVPAPALLASSGSSDVVDGHVVVVARTVPDAVVVTSDPGDIAALDPALRLVVV